MPEEPSRMDSRLAALVLLVPLAGGCFGHGSPAPAAPTLSFEAPPPEPRSFIARGSVPQDFQPPTFTLHDVTTLMPALLAAQPLNPAIAGLGNGSLLLATPTCDRLEPLGPALRDPNMPGCQQRPVYLGSPDNLRWQRINKDPDGRIDRRSHQPYGQVDVAVDALGTLFVAMPDTVYNDVYIYRSHDAVTWDWIGVGVDPSGTARERPALVSQGRIAAAGAGHLLVAWRECESVNDTCWMGVKASRDAGGNWSRASLVGTHVRAVGPIRFAPDGEHAFIAFVEGAIGRSTLVLRLGESRDAGASWTFTATPFPIHMPAVDDAANASVPLPIVAPLGDGGLVVAWGDMVGSPGDAAATGPTVRFAVRGPSLAWSAASSIAPGRDARLGWAVGGAGGRFAIAFLQGALPAGGGTVETWDLHAFWGDASDGAARTLDALIQAGIHVGSFCASAVECRNAVGRVWLDSFQMTLLPDGRAAIAYPVDADQNVELRAAVQSGGSRLFVAGP